MDRPRDPPPAGAASRAASLPGAPPVRVAGFALRPGSLGGARPHAGRPRRDAEFSGCPGPFLRARLRRCAGPRRAPPRAGDPHRGDGAGGRRWAPDPSVVGETGAPAPAVAPVPQLLAGRHRATSPEGRHRAATDTGAWPALVADPGAPVTSAGDSWSPSPGRSVDSRPLAPARDGRSVRVEAEPDLLTRPMRLDDLVPRSRKPRLDGFLSNA